MLNFRTFSILVIIVIILLFLTNRFIAPVSSSLIIILILVCLLIFAYGSAFLCSGFFVKTVCRGNRNNKEISITFDDGPDSKKTTEILDILKKHEVAAIFFCIGKKAEEDQEIVRRAFSEGHLIGNHSYSHSLFFDFFYHRRIEKELNKTDAVIEHITGSKPVFFRPPYGIINLPIMYTLWKFNYIVTGWSLKSLDTSSANSEKIMQKLKKKLRNGDIVLFHDTTPFIGTLLEEFIMFTKDSDFTISRLDHLLEKM